MPRILIIEDERRIASFIDMGLQAAGFATVLATTGREGLAYLHGDSVDLVILDLGLPDMDGMDLLVQLRGGGSRVPVVILTARSTIEDIVAGFDAGAEDFLAKPFRFEELLVRVRARLSSQAHAVPSATHQLRSGDVVLDLLTRRARVDGRDVDLSAREFALAEEFIRHSGQVLTRTQLLDSVWGLGFDPGSNIVDVYVGYLRRKFGGDPVETVRGVGYRWIGS